MAVITARQEPSKSRRRAQARACSGSARSSKPWLDPPAYEPSYDQTEPEGFDESLKLRILSL
jgi:hypothetical protein